MPIERNMDWDANAADEEFAAIATAAMPRNTVKTAEEVFKLNAAAAASEIVTLALGAANERVRLDASKYVVDRVMGRVGDGSMKDNDEAPWAGVYGAIVRQEPSAAERNNGAQVTTHYTHTPSHESTD